MLPWFECRFVEQLDEFDEHNPAMAALIRRLEVIYLFGTIGIEAVLKPELAELLPCRPPAAANCRPCRGTGWLVQEVVCTDCGGLGWAGVPQ